MLTLQQQAPDFSVSDVNGHRLNLSQLRGQKVYLAFERNAGCPVCNLRTHDLLKQANYFQKMNMKVVMIYESTPEKMKEYLGDDVYPFHFVADPKNELYKKYYVGQSGTKFMRSMFNGLFSKVKAGSKLFRKPMKQDGHMATIPSEFVVDERGKLSTVHYGRFIGDHLPVVELN